MTEAYDLQNLSWAFTPGTNKPVETQEKALQTNDNSWVYTTTISLATPYYRVRCLGQSGTYSGWRTATLSTNPQLFVQIPDGKTIQDIYVWK